MWSPVPLAAALLLAAAMPVAAHPSWGIVADAEGRVYFSDLESVWRLDPDGRLSLFRPPVGGVHVHELAVAPDGSVRGDQLRYDPAAETWHAGIWRRGADGGEAWLLAPTTAPPNGSGLAVDRAGNSYTTQWPSNDDRRTMLWRLGRDGRSALLFGDSKAATGYRQVVVASVGGMAFAPDGSLLFGDGALVRRRAPDGGVGTIYRGPAGAEIRGLAVGPDGIAHAADIANHRLLAIGPGGKARIVHRSEPGWAPSGVAVAGGRLLLLEAEEDPAHLSHRVRVVEIKDGKARVVATPGAAAPGGAASPPGERTWQSRGATAIIVTVGLSAAAALGLAFRAARRRALGAHARS